MVGDRDVKRGTTGSRRTPRSNTPHNRSSTNNRTTTTTPGTSSAAANGKGARIHRPAARPGNRTWSVFGGLGSLIAGGFTSRADSRRKTENSSDGSPRTRRRHDGSRRDRDRPPAPAHRIKIELRDLDHARSLFLAAVRQGAVVARLESALRRHLHDLGRPIPGHVPLFLYSEGRELSPDAAVDGLVTVWYRIQTRPDDGATGRFRFTHLLDDTNGQLDSALTSELERAIDQGATVGELRRRIAQYMRVDDMHRVVVYARDGMRKGLVEGDSWEARQLRNWLCSWLSIDAAPEKEYVVLRGLRREYTIHVGEPECRRRGIGHIRKLASHLVKNVVHHGKSKVAVDSPAVVLTHQGRRVGRNEGVALGEAYEFELPLDAAEELNKEESWLLPVTETCIVCADDKKVSEMPVRLTAACAHPPTTCRDCTAQWIQSSLDTTTWDHLKCPECPETLHFDDVRRCAAPDVFARYDKLATAAVLKEMRNFRWCLSTRCESGQIHDPKCARFECVACGARHCVAHNVPWHRGETCEEYDHRNRKKRRDERASEAAVKKMSKTCPGCKAATHKFDGCNHITCTRCRHEWCYVCFAPYQRNQHGFLFCAHTETCTEHDPFIDVIAPEFAPRRGPFVPGGPPGLGRPPHGARAGMWTFPFPPHHRRPPPPAPQPPPAAPAGPGDAHHGGPGGGPRFPPPPDGFHMEFEPPPPAPHQDDMGRFLAEFEQRFRLGEDGARGPRGPQPGAMFLDAMGEFLAAMEGARGGRRPNGVMGALDEFGVLHR